jgi:hypothetical protein
MIQFIFVVVVVATADYDLTGQLVWPGAELLNDYLANHSEILNNLSVIELGSGVGKQTPSLLFPPTTCMWED